MKRPVLDLRRGQPLAPPPAGAMDAGRRALDTGCSAYTHPLGLPALREAVAEALHQETGASLDPTDEIMVTTGASAGLVVALAGLTQAGDGVLVPDPGWPQCIRTLHILGRRALPWSACPPLAAPPAPMPQGATALMLNAPHNPTGRLLDADGLAALERLVQAHPALVIIADETYHALVFDGRHNLSPLHSPRLRPHTVVVRSFSKTAAMAGWRVGYLAAPAPLAAGLAPLLEAMHGCAATPAQEAARWVLRHGAAALAAQRDRYQALRDGLVARLAPLPGLVCQTPESTFYLFIRVGGDDRALAAALAREQQILVTPGSTFGPAGAGHLRLCFAHEQPVLQEAADRLERFFSGHLHPQDNP